MGLLEQYLYKNCVKKGLYREINMEGAAHDMLMTCSLKLPRKNKGPADSRRDLFNSLFNSSFSKLI